MSIITPEMGFTLVEHGSRLETHPDGEVDVYTNRYLKSLRRFPRSLPHNSGYLRIHVRAGTIVTKDLLQGMFIRHLVLRFHPFAILAPDALIHIIDILDELFIVYHGQLDVDTMLRGAKRLRRLHIGGSCLHLRRIGGIFDMPKLEWFAISDRSRYHMESPAVSPRVGWTLDCWPHMDVYTRDVVGSTDRTQ